MPLINVNTGVLALLALRVGLDDAVPVLVEVPVGSLVVGEGLDVPLAVTVAVAVGVPLFEPVGVADGETLADGDGVLVLVAVSFAVGEGVGVELPAEFVFDWGDGLGVGDGLGDGEATAATVFGGISTLMTEPGASCEPLNAPAAPAPARARTPTLRMPKVRIPRPNDEPRKRRTLRPSASR